jgi:hypothetical protein
MKELKILRCWKNLNDNNYVTLVLLLEKFRMRFNVSINLCITHMKDDSVKKTLELYISDLNKKFNSNHSINFISVKNLDEFLISDYNIGNDFISKLKQQPVLYNVALAFYSRKVLNMNYTLFHDDDILYTRSDIDEVLNLLDTEEPFAMAHPYSFSDMSLVGKLSIMLGKDVFTPYFNKFHGSTNTGYMGILLECLDIFTKQNVKDLFETVFRYDAYSDDVVHPHFEDGTFSFSLYSQEQSFFSLISRAKSKQFTTLSENDGYKLFLDIENLERYNPKIHHYIYDLKNSSYYVSFLEYYKSKIDRKVDLFTDG